MENSNNDSSIANGGIGIPIGGASDASSGMIFSAGILTSALFLFSLGVFVALAIKSKTLKSFQSQISLFVGIYVVGELLELKAIPAVTGLPADMGSQVHVAATIIITVVLWSRLFYSGKAVKRLVDPDGSTEQKG